MTPRCPFCGEPPAADEYERIEGALVLYPAGYCCPLAQDADDGDDPYDDAGHEARMIAYAVGVIGALRAA
jgi:hypothetical protein